MQITKFTNQTEIMTVPMTLVRTHLLKLSIATVSHNVRTMHAALITMFIDILIFKAVERFEIIAMIEDELMPISSVNMGPPKQAEMAMAENPILATVKLEIKSPSESPSANIVNPMKLSLISQSCESTNRILTSSVARKITHASDMPNPVAATRNLEGRRRLYTK